MLFILAYISLIVIIFIYKTNYSNIKFYISDLVGLEFLGTLLFVLVSLVIHLTLMINFEKYNIEEITYNRVILRDDIVIVDDLTIPLSNITFAPSIDEGYKLIKNTGSFHMNLITPIYYNNTYGYTLYSPVNDLILIDLKKENIEIEK